MPDLAPIGRDCGCTVELYEEFWADRWPGGNMTIAYCPLHQAAGETARQRDELLEASQRLVKGLDYVAIVSDTLTGAKWTMMAVIAKIKATSQEVPAPAQGAEE